MKMASSPGYAPSPLTTPSLQEAQALKLEPFLVLWHEIRKTKGRAEGWRVDEYVSQFAISILIRRAQTGPIPARVSIYSI